jgi:hypothetical protein
MIVSVYLQPELKKEAIPYNQPFYFIINMAIGGNLVAQKWMIQYFLKFFIDYIKVYQ